MTYPAKVAALGATAYYRLGEASGTVINDEIGTADGTYVNTPDLAQTGAIRDGDTAVNFKSASAERGTLTTLGTFGSHLGTCSVAFWVKSTTTAQTALLGAFNSGTATAIQFTANADTAGTAHTGWTRFLIRNEAGTATRCAATTNLYDGNWHFVVAVVDATASWNIYIDGVSSPISGGSGTGSGTYANLAVAMDIAARNNNGTHGSQFDGSLDEVAFFPTQLAASEVADLYYEGAIKSNFGSTQTSGTYYTAVQALSPKLYWRLDETATSYYVKDISGNGNDGFYYGPDITAGSTGRIDSDAAVKFTNQTGTGIVRALSYAPFAVNGQITVAGVSRLDVEGSPGWTGFRNLFSGFPLTNNKSNPVLEWGGGGNVRWYTDVTTDFPNFASTDWDDTGTDVEGNWVHWAFTYDDSVAHGASAATFYLNGVAKTPSIGGVTWANDFVQGDGRFQVGNRQDGGLSGLTENWIGEHDEITVWDRILTQNEIRGLTAAAGLAFFDSRSVTVTLAPTGSGFYGFVGTGSATATVAPTRTESASAADSRSVSVGVTPIKVDESFQTDNPPTFNDSGSASAALTPTRTESAVLAGTGSASVPLAATGTEVYAFVDARSATVALSPSGSGGTVYTDAQPLTAALTPSALAALVAADSRSVTVPVTPTGSGVGFDDARLVNVLVTPFSPVNDDTGFVFIPITPLGIESSTALELTGLVGSQDGHMERDESGHMELATAGRTT